MKMKAVTPSVYLNTYLKLALHTKWTNEKLSDNTLRILIESTVSGTYEHSLLYVATMLIKLHEDAGETNTMFALLQDLQERKILATSVLQIARKEFRAENLSMDILSGKQTFLVIRQ